MKGILADFELLLKYLDYLVIQKLRFVFGLRTKSSKKLKIYLQAKSRIKNVWLDEQIISGKVITKSKSPAVNAPPIIYNGETFTQESIESSELPEYYQYHIEGGVEFGISTSRFLVGKNLITERVQGVDKNRCSYPNGHWEEHSEGFFTTKKKQNPIELPNGIFLGGNGTSNYYHWLIEILPKLEQINQLPERFSPYPLLVSQHVKDTPQLSDSLKAFNPHRQVIYLKEDLIYKAQKLLIYTSPSLIPFNLKKGNKPNPLDYKLCPDSLLYIRNKLLSDHVKKDKKASKRIFFSQRRHRRKYNEDEIYELFRPHGFEKVYMDELSLREQILLIREAEYIAGPTGAAWTNLLFCKKGTKCICWMDEFISSFAAFSSIAKVFELRLYYITYKSNASSTGDVYGNSYTLSIEKTDKLIKEVVENPSRSSNTVY